MSELAVATEENANAQRYAVTIRLSVDERVLLGKLVDLASQREGRTVSAAALIRGLLAREAQAEGISLCPGEHPPTRRTRLQAKPVWEPEVVRYLLCTHGAQMPGLAAELARRLGVQPAQLSRFKAGTERFPAAKLDELARLIHQLAGSPWKW
jgi:hypothetical protein